MKTHSALKPRMSNIPNIPNIMVCLVAGSLLGLTACGTQTSFDAKTDPSTQQNKAALGTAGGNHATADATAGGSSSADATAAASGGNASGATSGDSAMPSANGDAAPAAVAAGRTAGTDSSAAGHGSAAATTPATSPAAGSNTASTGSTSAGSTSGGSTSPGSTGSAGLGSGGGSSGSGAGSAPGAAPASPIASGGTTGTGSTGGNSGGVTAPVPPPPGKPCSRNYTVAATANPYFAGVNDGAIIDYSHWVGDSSNPIDTAGGQGPVLVQPIGSDCIKAGSTLTFSVSGSITYNPGIAGTDGNGNAQYVISHALGALYGKSNITAPINSLLGVFISDADPEHMTAPDALNYTTQAARDYVTLSPKIGQVFFIGTGRTSGGDYHQVKVPEGATRLYFAVMDGWQWNNNVGKLTGAIYGSN